MVLCTAIGVVPLARSTTNDWVWWEGEDFSSSDFPASTWLEPSDADEENKLSADDLLSNYDDAGIVGYAEYSVNVPQAAEYRLYARKLWRYGPFTWRFDTAPWTTAGVDLQHLDSVEYKPSFPLNWVFLGNVTLTAGAHAFRIQMDPSDHPPEDASSCRIAGNDAFILSIPPFAPRGKLKPNENYGFAEPGMWNFEPDNDSYLPSALLDLRYLNEPVAGQSGFVRLEGDKFVLGNGDPVRFWSVCIGNYASDIASLSQQAKFFAKRGVNMVRFFHSIESTADNPPIKLAEQAIIDGAHRTVAAYKAEGIYTKICPFFVLNFKVWASWGVPGYTEDTVSPFAVPMFDDDLKDAYKAWVGQLFTNVNPHTGITLAADPAVGIIEVQNEDNFFFWTFNPNNMPDAQRLKLEEKFGTYLTDKHGSVADAIGYWGTLTTTGPWATDDPANGRMALTTAWYMTHSVYATKPPEMRRLADQIQFLTELQRSYYQEMVDYCRNDLGCQSLISPSNWRTADESSLMDVERYTYMIGEITDDHHYFTSVHTDPNVPDDSSHSVHVGDYYQSAAAVLNPRRLPPIYKLSRDRATIMSESTWTNPNRFKAEGPLLVAAYCSLVDIDGWFWFATDGIGYVEDYPKFPVSVPSLMGQFPGAALLYRRGDVAEAPVVVRDERTLSEMYFKERAIIWKDQNYDPTSEDPSKYDFSPATGEGRMDPLAMLVGKMESVFKTNDAVDYVSPEVFARIDNSAGTVRSTTDEVELNWTQGVFRVSTPRHQSVAGFLGGVHEMDLDDVTIVCSNEFGAVMVVSLDHNPIRDSSKILIQAMTEDNPYQWIDQDKTFDYKGKTYDGKEIVSLGQPPYNVVDIHTKVILKGVDEVLGVTILDENGYAREPGTGTVTAAGFEIVLPEDSLYTIVTRGTDAYAQWVAIYFTNPLVDANDRLRSSDPDGDGLVNVVEFTFGLNPLVADRDDGPWQVFAGADTFTYVFSTATNPPSGYELEAHTSTNLQDWAPATIGTTNLSDYVINMPLSGGDLGYIRLRLRRVVP